MTKGIDGGFSLFEIFFSTTLRHIGIYILTFAVADNDRSLFHFVYYKKSFDLEILFIKIHMGTDKHF